MTMSSELFSRAAAFCSGLSGSPYTGGPPAEHFDGLVELPCRGVELRGDVGAGRSLRLKAGDLLALGVEVLLGALEPGPFGLARLRGGLLLGLLGIGAARQEPGERDDCDPRLMHG
jgi:hypothetical protein